MTTDDVLNVQAGRVKDQDSENSISVLQKGGDVWVRKGGRESGN